MSPELDPQPVPLAAYADGGLRVGGTRVLLESVVALFDQGATPEEIVESFPVLELADVYATIAWTLRHRREVERYLAAREERAQENRVEGAARFDQSGLRERLLARLPG